jgi:hypothetical protein
MRAFRVLLANINQALREQQYPIASTAEQANTASQ